MKTLSQPLVSCDWLASNIDNPNLIVLDASIASIESKNLTVVRKGIIPHTRFFDLKNTFRDQQSNFPAMMPSKELFERSARALGVNKDSLVVIYDNLGIYSSPRVWWMFMTMGHKNVAILDGGLPEWHRLGLSTEINTEFKGTRGDFEAFYEEGCVSSMEDVVTSLEKNNVKILDARSSARFTGTSPEPRKGLRRGHIPGSLNLPFKEVLCNGKMKPMEELILLFRELNIQDEKLIFTCGSGVTACIILLAAEIIGLKNKSVYDGSWCEWATRIT